MHMLRLLLLLCSLLLVLPARCSGIQATLVSDIHYDPLYGKTGGFGRCGVPSPPLSPPGCESSPELVASLSKDIAAGASTYTFMAGDAQRHAFSVQIHHINDTFGYVIEKLAEASRPTAHKDVPTVVVAMGNNDMVPNYYFDVTKPTSNIFQEDSILMQEHGVLTAEEANQSERCAYYLRVVSPTLRVIVLHSLVWCHEVHPSIPDTEADPCGQFQFLTTELANARKAHAKVIILTHIPPYIDLWKLLRTGSFTAVAENMYWKPMYQTRFNQLMKKYSGTVTVQLYGHTHLFSFQALTGGVPSFIIPATTPLYKNIPSYFIAHLKDEDFSLRSLIQRYLNNGTWTNGLLVEDVLGDLTNISSLQESAMRLITDDKLWKKYLTLRAGGVENDDLFPKKSCDLWCRASIACSMVSDTWEDIAACVNKNKHLHHEAGHSKWEIVIPVVLSIVFFVLLLGIAILIFRGRMR
ncbi:beta-fructofuranosidase-like protein [Trypanosoma rangeli]|uniref:Beta-fructofuranosidase-like protein n=1 Tax=Trypanosoma rangeli TaxID=5698 RepID=A0A3R7K6I9_TRYRA|nr:beta-fructofuranosidase-like protein [Trypanosoma rangeli]RNF00778.1 beta-fructofuranosidase-like protein [Trypanosoma rangeli]|eukprot:RNF00778.1 beta-fructofuranosidase-like protein [Trypanosoma rangeli]